MIGSFNGKYRFLSNFYLCGIDYEGRYYPSVENAYQAAKTLSSDQRFIFTDVSPIEAKKKGRGLKIREDWETAKFKVMLDLLRIKFNDGLLKKKLLDTGSQELVEGNYWMDQVWGVCNGKGENHLGKLLMQVRKEIKDGI